MKLRFGGAAAEAVGLEHAQLSLQTTLTVGEVLAILRNLYPGLRPGVDPRPIDRLQVYLNQLPAGADHPVSDADSLEIVATPMRRM